MKEKLPNMMSIVTPQFQTCFTERRRRFLEYMATNYPRLDPEEIRYEDGSRYIRIFRGSSCEAFIDKTNGDVLKAATFRAPAKWPRGNIFDAHNGLGTYHAHTGPAYLR
jgi:hypothetical protein